MAHTILLSFTISESKGDIYSKSIWLVCIIWPVIFLFFQHPLQFCEPAFLLTSQRAISPLMLLGPPLCGACWCSGPGLAPFSFFLYSNDIHFQIPSMIYVPVISESWSQTQVSILNSRIYCLVKLVRLMYGQCLLSSYHFLFVCWQRHPLLPLLATPLSHTVVLWRCSFDKEHVSVLDWWVDMGDAEGFLSDLPNSAGKPVYLNQIMNKNPGQLEAARKPGGPSYPSYWPRVGRRLWKIILISSGVCQESCKWNARDLSLKKTRKIGRE